MKSATATVRPYAVDVSSGVEAAPGIKDENKLRAFFAALQIVGLCVRQPSFQHSAIAIPTRAATTATTAAASFPRRSSRRSPSSSARTSRRGRIPRSSSELEDLLRNYVGRATPLYEARRLSGSLGGARIFLKREDLAHTGAHKINNALGQALLARRMGKRRIIAETGAGQHGVATATVCALLGLTCDVYMGAEDMERQSLNVFRMQLLGATVRRVDAGAQTLKDAINEAMRDWVTNVTRQLLPARLGARAAPVSADGARVPVGDRPGGARAVPRRDRPAARHDRRLRRRRQQRHGHLRRVRRRSAAFA